MGTRSVIAVRNETGGWKGRYCHWDGYPEGVGAAVQAIVERDGVEKAIKTLTEDHYGWSSVDVGEAPVLGPGYDDGRFVAVPGYGIAYTTKDGQSDPDVWISSSESIDWWGWGCEYVHIIDPKTGEVVSQEL